MSITFYGERLRQLRLINDKSLLDVGNAIYTTKQYIQQLERDVQKPTELTLDALASYFDVLPNFFELPYSNRIYEADCYFRKAKSTPLNVKEKAQHFASLLEDYVAFIEDEFELPSISFLEKDYDYTKLSNIQIEQAADELRKSWGLDLDTPIDNMTKALENAGAIVTYFDELSDKIDAFSINRKRPIVIRNNEKESGCRLRFDLAHECGHLVLHKYADNSIEDDIKEEQANRFASALLLPRQGFCQEFYEVFMDSRINWSRMLSLKERWRVSFGAIIRRAYDLGLIDAVKYRGACIYLRKSGQSKKEYGDDYIEIETSNLLNRITSSLLNDYKGDLTDFIKNRGWSVNLMEKITSMKLSSLYSYMKTALSSNVIDINQYRLPSYVDVE